MGIRVTNPGGFDFYEGFSLLQRGDFDFTKLQRLPGFYQSNRSHFVQDKLDIF
jgi:hypothetical protein